MLTSTATKQLRQWLVGVLLLSGVIVAVLHRSEIAQFAELAEHAKPLWLGVGVVLQCGTYICVAASWHVALRRLMPQVSLLSLVPLAVAKLFSDQAMPSGGMSGTVFFVAALNRRGVPNSICLATLLVSIVSSYMAALLAAALSVTMLFYFHELQPWILAVAGVFALVAVAIPVSVLTLQHWGGRKLPRWVLRTPLLGKAFAMLGKARGDLIRDPFIVWTAAMFQMVVILLDAATLWFILRAIGPDAPLWIVLPSFFTASMVAMIGPIPLGLGTFEATCVAMLHLLGVAVVSALTATLLFRGLTMWLPMLPGLWLARRELRFR